MRIAVPLLLSLLICPAAHGGEPVQPPRARREAGRLRETTAGGAYIIDLSVKGGELALGVNALDLTVRDQSGKGVPGAKVAVTPWMPSQGHGVWDKPEVTERSSGDYHVENVKIVLAGRWELRVSVKAGAVEDRAVFPFSIGVAEPVKEAVKPRGYTRTVAYYRPPDVTLTNQDGRRVKLRSLLESGRPAVVDFIYTTCTTICPILSSGFSGVREELGDRAAESVQLISISIDPEHDRPEQMKEYLGRFTSGEGWDFLTGSRDDIDKVLKAFDSVVADKMAHQPIYLFHGPGSDEWTRVNGLIGQADLMRELGGVDNR
jgi:protein SCO1/2